MKLLCFYRHKKKGAKQQRDKFSSDKAFCENKEICCVKTHHSFSVYFPLLACQIKKYHICSILSLDIKVKNKESINSTESTPKA